MAKPIQRRRQIAGRISPAKDVIAVENPLVNAYDGGRDGATIGTVVGTGQNYDLNLDELMDEGRIGSKQIIIFGSINSRKTTLAKSIVLNEARVSHGGRRPRIGVDDVNRRNGVPEWGGKFAEAFKSRPLTPERPINPFDSNFGFTFAEDMETINDLYNVANNDVKITGDQELILQICLSKMRDDYPAEASLPMLDKIVSRYNRGFYDEYVEKGNKQFTSEVASRITNPKSKNKLETLEALPTIYQEEAMQRAAFDVHERLQRQLKGEFGNAFGGVDNQITFNSLRQRAVIKDYTNQSERVIKAKRKFFMRLRRSAVQRSDRRFITDIEVQDEDYRNWRDPEQAEAQSDHMKEIRDTNGLLVKVTHRPRDYTTVGPVNSRQWQLATNMLSDIDIMLIGALKKRDVDELREYIDLGKREASSIRAQGPGQFCVKIKDEEIVPIDTNVTYSSILREVSQSNGALDEMLQRNRVIDEGFYEFPEEESDES